MTDTCRLFVLLGALGMASAIALGAFGAHALRARVEPADLAIWQTGVQYHLVHALGLFVVAFIAESWPEITAIRWVGGLMVAGMLLFSGSLYLLVLSGLRWLGAVTPVGGIAFIAAWSLLAWKIWRA